MDIQKVHNWELVITKSVGGLEWIGFSKKSPEKLLCISSQKSTLIDCSNGEIVECETDYDESNFIAVCDKLPNEEIALAGQYGGELPHVTAAGDSVLAVTDSEYITEVFFASASQKRTEIFKNYGFYCCGFSYDGNYFVFAGDAGITILKRTDIF